MTKLYLAGTTFYDGGGSITQGGIFDQDVAARVNLLESFYHVADWQTRNIHRFNSFMLDSGAYTFAYGAGGSVDWNDYLQRYIEYINQNNVELFFELDIDSLVGYPKVLEMRETLEAETGKRCIPVWHVERGLEALCETCESYDYVAIGGIATKDGRVKVEPYLPQLTKIAHERGTKVHGLGYTNLKNLRRSGFDSVDSTAWLYGNIGGYIYVWDGHSMRRIQSTKKLNAKEAARHNFMQWVEMADALSAD